MQKDRNMQYVENKEVPLLASVTNYVYNFDTLDI